MNANIYKSKKQDEPGNVRLATLAQLRSAVLPLFINPLPTNVTIRTWFDGAKIPRFKSNPSAKRGGGSVFYSVSHVEQFFRKRITGGRIN